MTKIFSYFSKSGAILGSERNTPVLMNTLSPHPRKSSLRNSTSTASPTLSTVAFGDHHSMNGTMNSIGSRNNFSSTIELWLRLSLCCHWSVILYLKCFSSFYATICLVLKCFVPKRNSVASVSDTGGFYKPQLQNMSCCVTLYYAKNSSFDLGVKIIGP